MNDTAKLNDELTDVRVLTESELDNVSGGAVQKVREAIFSALSTEAGAGLGGDPR